MTYYFIENRIGLGSPTDIGSTQLYPLGTIAQGQDSSLGNGEFIYLAGASGTVTGSVVTFRPNLGLTVPVPTTSEQQGSPVAVAMAACNTADTYGWYQFEGTALVAKGAVDFATNNRVFMSAVTAGYVTSASGSYNMLLGALTANSASVSSTTSTIYITLNRPHLQGEAT